MKKFLLLLLILGFAFIFKFKSLIIEDALSPISTYAQSSSSWPQLQHDFQRSARAPHALVAPFQTKWKWLNGDRWNGEAYQTLDAEIPILSQPIVGDGKLYVGSYNGKLYAIDEQSGNTVWSFQAGLAILHTAAYNNEKVYVGSLDGYFYAINSTDGSLAWKYQTGPIYSAPLIVNNRVCIGSKTNHLYCFNLEDLDSDEVGDVIFSYDAEAPIYQSAAASPDQTKIYFGSEDMYPHCLVANSTAQGGQICTDWNAQVLPGQSFIHHWPVAVDDKVIFTTLPIYPTGEHTHGLFGNIETLFDSTSATSWTTIQRMLIFHYQDHPYDQTFFVLNGDTGQKAYDTAVSHLAMHMGARMPPALGPNNEVYVMYRSKNSSLNSNSYGTKYPLEIGKMDIDTGLLSPFGQEDEFRGCITHCLDDPSILSSGGDIVYGLHPKRFVAALNTISRSDFMVAKNFEQTTSDNCIADTPFFFPVSAPDQPIPSIDIRGYQNRGEGVMSPIIVGDSMYIVFSGGAILAIQGSIR